MSYMYQAFGGFVQRDHGIKSSCVCVYLQTVKGFHVEDGALIPFVAATLSTGSTGSGLLKK